MSAHKHTPGPWFGRPYHDPILIQGCDEVGLCIAFSCGGGGQKRDEFKANARLIAAVPDSHEANVMFVKAMDRFCGIKPDWDDDCIYDELPSSELALAYFAARAAIAKATGEPA